MVWAETGDSYNLETNTHAEFWNPLLKVPCGAIPEGVGYLLRTIWCLAEHKTMESVPTSDVFSTQTYRSSTQT